MTATLDAAATKRAFGWKFVTPMYVGSALNPVNSSLIATALVPIAHGIDISVGRTALLVSALYLASAIAQPTGGKLGEVLGPRRVFLGGITLVCVGGIVGGIGSNLATLAVARVLIGIGTSGGYPSAMLIIRRRAQEAGLDAPPGRVLGRLQIAGTATAALGLPLGGLLVDGLGWRSTFLINIPVTVVAFVLAAAWLPRDPAREQPLRARELVSRIDLTGIALFAASLCALLLFLENLPDTQWAYLIAAAAFAGVLVQWERHAATPFLDVRLLVANLALTRTYLRFGLTSLCVYTVLYGLSEWLEAAHGYSSRTVGLLVLPMTAISAVVMGPVAGRNLVRPALVLSAVTSLVGSLGLLLIGTGTPVVAVVGVTLVFGITLGTFAAGNQTALYTQADPDQIGTAAGLLRTFGYLGSIGSSALIGVFFQRDVSDGGLHGLAATMAVISVLGLALVLLDRRLARPTRHV